LSLKSLPAAEQSTDRNRKYGTRIKPNQNMAMFDRAWLPDLAREQIFDWKLDWKLANGSAICQRESAPAHFPQSIDAEMVWTGAEFQEKPDVYRVELQKQHVGELEDAAAEFEGKSPSLPA
jgi:hypothetical protein